MLLKILHSAATVNLMCFVWISEQTAIISLYSTSTVWIFFTARYERSFCIHVRLLLVFEWLISTFSSAGSRSVVIVVRFSASVAILPLSHTLVYPPKTISPSALLCYPWTGNSVHVRPPTPAASTNGKFHSLCFPPFSPPPVFCSIVMVASNLASSCNVTMNLSRKLVVSYRVENTHMAPSSTV